MACTGPERQVFAIKVIHGLTQRQKACDVAISSAGRCLPKTFNRQMRRRQDDLGGRHYLTGQRVVLVLPANWCTRA
jgi:hypothetical protein